MHSKEGLTVRDDASINLTFTLPTMSTQIERPHTSSRTRNAFGGVPQKNKSQENEAANADTARPTSENPAIPQADGQP